MMRDIEASLGPEDSEDQYVLDFFFVFYLYAEWFDTSCKLQTSL
jgi:hypothetical protein